MRSDDNRAPALDRVPAVNATRAPLTYVLPLRRWSPEPLDELAGYLTWLVAEQRVEVVVVDGSSADLFRRHRAALGAAIRHMSVERAARTGYDKVNGVLTGVRAASNELVVIADDDVRYDEGGLRAVVRLLDHADLVRPQNYFSPLPWHARWDTARSLINRAVAHDYPGTLAVRRSTLMAAGGYDCAVLFENLELIRTVEAAGGVVVNDRSLYVRRLPASSRHFWSQRVRQAYDSFAQPFRLTAELSLLPSMLWLAARRRFVPLAAGVVAAAGLAESGRRRAHGTSVFPWSASLFGPVWVLERAVCAWLAVWQRIRHGGMRYAGTTLVRAASSRRTLARRYAARVRDVAT